MMLAWIGTASLVTTLLVYLAAKRIYKRYRFILLSPVLVTPILLILLLSLLDLPYGSYMSGAHWLANLLGPATVAFAIPMHRHFDVLKKHAGEILLGVLLGCLLALLVTVPLARWLHLTPETVLSLAPHSITSPVAMEVARLTGGTPTMAAAFVIVTGLLGLMIGQFVLRLLPIRSRVARGALFGMGAHGIGTSKAFELGSVEGTVSSLVMIIAAGATVLLTPLVLAWL